MPVLVGGVRDAKLVGLRNLKMTDDVRSKSERAHPDQRLEISLLGLFSYDKLSTVAREKGSILPPESYLSKLLVASASVRGKFIVRAAMYGVHKVLE